MRRFVKAWAGLVDGPEDASPRCSTTGPRGTWHDTRQKPIYVPGPAVSAIR